MDPSRRARWSLFITALILAPLVALANSGGGPWGHSGDFGEPGCEGSGCHRTEPFPPGHGSVTVDVGPYVPGQKQRVKVTISDAGGRAWGFQMSARQLNNPQRQAGTFTPALDDQFVWIHCADGSFQPCVNQLEYATHTSAGTRQGIPAVVVTFFLDWTAPATDVGPIAFSAAGMGADGDRGTNGDHTYYTRALSLYAPSNQPTLRDGGVVNGASFSPIAPISPGALVSLFGDKLAPPGFQRQVTPADLIDRQLPIELSRVGADFYLPGPPGNPLPAYMLFVAEKQMNVQVPALPAGFSGPVDVQPVFNRGQGSNEVRGNRVSVNVQQRSPALFTFSDGKSVAAVTPSGAPIGKPGQFPNSRPAARGDILLVYGTGYGQSIPPVPPGSLAGDPASLAGSVSARIGGVFLAASDILYAGVAPSFAGLYQFNLRVPAGVPSGDQPIIISISQIDSQLGVILSVQ